MTMAFTEEVEKIAADSGLIPDSERMTWSPDAIEPVNWERLAALGKEPVNMKAWKAWQAARFGAADADATADQH